MFSGIAKMSLTSGWARPCRDGQQKGAIGYRKNKQARVAGRIERVICYDPVTQRLVTGSGIPSSKRCWKLPVRSPQLKLRWTDPGDAAITDRC